MRAAIKAGYLSRLTAILDLHVVLVLVSLMTSTSLLKPQKANLSFAGDDKTYHINLVNQYRMYEACLFSLLAQ